MVATAPIWNERFYSNKSNGLLHSFSVMLLKFTVEILALRNYHSFSLFATSVLYKSKTIFSPQKDEIATAQ